MITLSCAKCGATLDVDDGFAGGTCRCATCGTIQTVPARDAPSSLGRLFGSTGCKPIFERAGDVAIASSVPAEPTGVPAEDGRPRATRATRPPPTAGPIRRAWPAVLLVLICGAVAVAMAVLLYRRINRVLATAPTTTEPLVAPATRRAIEPLTEGPRFGSIRLTEPGRIAYLIDRDAATAALADPIRAAIVESLATLPSEQSATVGFWLSTRDGDASPSSLSPAGSSDWTEPFVRWPTTAPTDGATTVRWALSFEPADEVVLISARGWRLESTFADAVLAAIGDRKVKVHTVSLGTANVAGPLAKISAATGGEAVALTAADLSHWAPSAR